MSSFSVSGLDDLINDLEHDKQSLKRASNSIAREVASEILDEAVKNVSGPKTNNEKYMAFRNAISLKAGTSYRATMKAFNQPYPVGRRTGLLARSLKARRVKMGIYRVFSDPDVAEEYPPHVHDGTIKMRPRPFLDDAVIDVIDSGKAEKIAMDILEDSLKDR